MLYDTAKMAVSLNGLPELAYHVVKMIQSQCGVQKKCVICDLDNTLWGGVIGDDGIGGIEIGEHGTGPAYTEFQLWLKELKKRGILLCICSKNEEQTAKKAFCEHPDMVLRLEDITVFVANWDVKLQISDESEKCSILDWTVWYLLMTIPLNGNW